MSRNPDEESDGRRDEPGGVLSHYRLLEKLGEGGMGVVWKAEDAVLRRTVAIKVLPGETAGDEKRRAMFLEEARLASSVGDARVAQVFELGRDGDVDFIVMEYVDGAPLARTIEGGPAPPERVVRIGLDIARALDRVHSRGLVHRDLKPANVLETREGDVKLIDFGLATLLAPAAAGAGSEDRTRPGRTSPAPFGAGAGTLPYMAPEQLRGETADPRTDVYALGVLLYEMATGRRPYQAATPADLIGAILSGRSVRLGALVPDAPAELERIVAKALAPRAGDRYGAMREMVADLEHLAKDLALGSAPSHEMLEVARGRRRRWRIVVSSSAALLVLMATAGTAWKFAARLASAPLSVVVAPFEVRGQAEKADYVGISFAEALAVGLAEAKALRVLPVPSAVELPATPGPDRRRRIAELGADRLVTGALAREGSGVRATLQLLAVRDNSLVWGTEREAADGNLASLATSLAADLAARLGASAPKTYRAIPNLAGGPRMQTSLATGRTLAAVRKTDITAAIASSLELVEAFPTEPDAHALRVWALILVFDQDPTLERREAVERAIRALESVDPGNPYVELGRAHVAWIDGRPREFIERCSRVLERSDLAADARAWCLARRALARRVAGDYATSAADLEEALRLDPANASILSELGAVLRAQGKTEDAVARMRQALALEPDSMVANQYLGGTLAAQGRWEESLGPAERACVVARTAEPCAFWALSLLRAGRRDQGREVYRSAAALPASIWGCYALASVEAVDGKRGQALDHLRRSVELGLAHVAILDDPSFASLRGDPEFEKLVAEVKRRIEKR